MKIPKFVVIVVTSVVLLAGSTFADLKVLGPLSSDNPPEPKQAKKDREALEKEKAEETTRKQARMQKIQQLVLDRRASTILKTWSDVAQKKDDPKTKSKNGTSKTAAKADPFDEEIKLFQQHVTLGRWRQAKEFFRELPADEAKALYTRMLSALQRPMALSRAGMTPEQIAQSLMQQQQRGTKLEPHSFTFDDALAMADCCPSKLESTHITTLGAILRQVLASGNVVEKLVERLKDESAKNSGVLTKRQAAKLLMAAGRVAESGDFLPDVETAKKENDFDGLNMLSRFYLQQHQKEEKTEFLEKAWDVVQAVLASDKTKEVQKALALQRAVDIAPKIREELGEAWLNESFTKRPTRGMEILAAIGSATAQGLQRNMSSPTTRLKSLKLQTTAVESLLKASPERAREWESTLDLLARNWLEEAKTTYTHDKSTSRGPNLQRDTYGNYFYYDSMRYNNSYSSSRIQAIKTGEMLEIKPSGEWLEFVGESLKPKFDMVCAQLYLKVSEDDNAFPYIESLAQVYPEMAEDLVAEFLRVWTTNHDPNASRNRTNYYMYMYGYERKAESIPLTRSKQERNLTELSELVARLRKLPVEIDESQIAKAFTTCHSQAEVYRLEAIERVFGSMEELEPKTISELAQQMRANLTSVWRAPAVQKDNKTKRKQKDIQAEVQRGYEVAQSVLKKALKEHPSDWTLLLAKASLDHDENNYIRELGNDSKFSSRQKVAFADFATAAQAYADSLDESEEDEWTTRPFDLWYYASLGACDLNQVTDEKVPDAKQPDLIRKAMLALPGEAAQKHVDMFANTLFTRMSSVKPAVKYRYVKSGLGIVGDNELATEARQVFDYYKDLVTEIKLEAVVDGSTNVGHEQPFGIYVNIRHTKEIERESEGFGRYLQNQNSNSYYYNYGRPLANYRDKFEEIVNQAFEEHFEVQSVTFQKENVNSRAIEDDYGWRYTPYAYILLKARGPEVDKIPPLRIDLDFLDTSGYAIIPIESPPLAIDASQGDDTMRPVELIEVTQELDEREASEGKLKLNVKATGHGLIPELEDVVDFAPEGFDIVETEDNGVSVVEFDDDAEDNVVLAERSWTLTMQGESDLEELPKSFTFGAPKLDVKEVAYQRYNDADLESVEQTISLEQEYGETSYARELAIGIGLGVLALLLGAVCLIVILSHKPEAESTGLQVPELVTPFSVLGLLKQIEHKNGFNEERKVELASSINRIERYYFDNEESDEPDLKQIAETWVRRA